MAGVNPFVFWLTNFAWDFIVYFGIALVYAVLIYIFDTRLIFHTNGGFGAFVFVLLMLGVVGLPWAYIMSFPFKYVIVIIPIYHQNIFPSRTANLMSFSEILI